MRVSPLKEPSEGLASKAGRLLHSITVGLGVGSTFIYYMDKRLEKILHNNYEIISFRLHEVSELS